MSLPSAISLPTIAFFGSTGGCALAVLVRAIQAGCTCNALARNPQKLTTLLHARGLSPALVGKHLTIISGDIRDSSTVSRVLLVSEAIVDIIISGIGSTSVTFKFSLREPLAIGDPTICADGMRTILGALSTLQKRGRLGGGNVNESAQKQPLIVAISTTGIGKSGRGPSDVPWLLAPLYHWLLASPHRAKRAMEDVLEAYITASVISNTSTALAQPSGTGAARAIIVRPTLLSNGAAQMTASGKLRVGTEEAPAVGYSIARESVGGWIWQECCAGAREGTGEKWVGRVITLTE